MKKNIINGNEVVMTEKYEQAIKETFTFLDNYYTEHPDFFNPTTQTPTTLARKLMENKGFDVRGVYLRGFREVAVVPFADNLPTHLWRYKSK